MMLLSQFHSRCQANNMQYNDQQSADMWVQAASSAAPGNAADLASKLAGPIAALAQAREQVKAREVRPSTILGRSLSMMELLISCARDVMRGT